jgi:hypothetical protein
MAKKAGNKVKTSNAFFSSTFGLPPQNVSTTVKETEPWKTGCMDFMDYQAQAQSQDRQDDLRKFRILSGDFDIRDYSYVNDPLSVAAAQATDPNTGGKGKVTPGVMEKVQHYPIMVRPINTIIGEYIKRIAQLHGFYAKNESDYARNEYNRQKTEMLQEWATQKIMARVMQKVAQSGAQEGTPEYDQAIQQMTPSDIQDYMDREYVDVAEQVIQTLMKNIWKTESLDVEFIEGFKSACITAKEFYHIYSVNNKTRVRNISPIDVFYHKSPSARWISESQYAGFRWYLTPSSVIDMFGDKLTMADINEIEAAINPNAKKKNATATGNVAYDTTTYSNNYGDLNERAMGQAYDMISNYQHFGGSTYHGSNYGLIKVVRGYWKSIRQIGWLTTYDEMDKPVLTMVDENYQPKTELGEFVEITPINQIYTGAKIGDNIYIDIGPYQDQIIDMDNLEYCPLPIEGCTYNDANCKPYSLVDLMVPWNELYNIVAHELKEAMKSSIGRVLFMSIDHIPNIPGFDMNKWYYWARKFKIAWVKQPKNGPNTFNQFSSADMSFAQSMQTMMDALERIKQECDSIAGFAAGRVASQSQEQTLGQSNQALTASVNQTEYLFFKHAKLIERVMNQTMNLAKNKLKDNKFMRNLFDDYEQAFIDFELKDILNAKMGLYITNATDDQRKRAAMESLMQPAMQNGADFADMSELIMAETISETRQLANKLRKNSKAMQEQQASAAQAQNETLERIADKEIAMKLKIAEGNQDAQIKAAAIKTYGGMNNSAAEDADGDGMADMLEIMGLNLKQTDIFKKHALKEREIGMKERQFDKTLAMDEKQLRETRRKNDIAAAKASKSKS